MRKCSAAQCFSVSGGRTWGAFTRSSSLAANVAVDAGSAKLKAMPQACASQIGWSCLETNSIDRFTGFSRNLQSDTETHSV